MHSVLSESEAKEFVADLRKTSRGRIVSRLLYQLLRGEMAGLDSRGTDDVIVLFNGYVSGSRGTVLNALCSVVEDI